MPPPENEDLFRQLQETLDSDPNNPTHHYNLGLLLWRTGEQERAAERFVTSAKLNPNDGASFRFLGHYYSNVSVDGQRAAKCYQRAVNLNPEDAEAGEGLCDLLDGSGKESLEVDACREASEKSPRAFWAFRRLGYLLVHQRKWSEAVPNLQHAIRGYPACADLWEALGLAYQRLGMLTAAIKAYGRAIELDDSRVFALVESGSVLLMLGSYRKGVEQFYCALEIAPCNVSAHFGLASGLLGWAKDCINSGAFRWGSDLLEEASEVAKAGTRLSGNVSSAWKLIGDIQIAYAKCFPWEDESNSIGIDKERFESSIGEWKKTRVVAANCAKHSYQRALHLTPWQANMYTDVAISLDLLNSLEERNTPNLDLWPLPERMALGSLMLEGTNSEFWIRLGCLSNDYALKQHALIRGLQLDVSFSVAWAYLGKLYRILGENQLAVHAFDRARSIDPSLALPWAGVSFDIHERKSSPSEAYESCLRAVQILPLAEFQVGLGTLAAHSGHLLSPQVYTAVHQAVQRAPFYPESHNLKGLVHEARSDYQSAIASYRQARITLSITCKSNEVLKSCNADVSVNLARALYQAGHVSEAARECEVLKNEGLLDNNGLQIYVAALWLLGKYDQALTMARSLAQNVNMKQTYAAAALVLICKLIYCISGLDPAVAFILKLSRECLQYTKMGLTVSVINTLDPSKRLQSLLLSCLQSVTSHDVVTEIHTMLAMSKMISHESKQILEIHSGTSYLRKVLHMYPDSNLIRNHISSLLLSSGDWMAPHIANRCTVVPSGDTVKMGLRSSYAIHGSAGVACYANCATSLKFSFPTCKCELLHRKSGIHHLQKWFHQEPWNYEARYFLVINVLQKAREEKFPRHMCVTLKRLLVTALSTDSYMKERELYKHQKFLLLLCASEISLQCGDYLGCISHATSTLELHPHSNHLFFAHLQLCRAFAAQENLPNLRNAYMNCLQVKTINHIGWISLKYLESRYKLQSNDDTIDVNFRICLKGKGSSRKMWEAVFDLVCAQCYIWDLDFFSAEQVLARACSTDDADSCLLLSHGAICMELARRQAGSQFLSRAVVSLTKSQETSPVPLPIVSALLAQAEASLGSKSKWERNLRFEWFHWPAEMRPAELYFQMHLLSRQSKAGSNQLPSIESSESPERWLLRAIHLNPSCPRYWKILQKLTES